MLCKIKKTIVQYDMFRKGDSVLVGLSGGPDSVSLLYILKGFELKLSIAHLNHGLRGEESDSDQKFCEELGGKLGIPVYTKKVKIKKSEDAARSARYEFLEETANKIGVKKIALGHNADDEVETVLMRLLRGSGAKGLAGIPPTRKMGQVLIVRPLINIWREEILDYLKKRDINFREDSTNKELVFFRNKVRHELIPFLSKYNQNIKNILRNTGRNMAMLNEYLEDVVKKEIKDNKIEIQRLRKLHPAIRQEFIRKIAQRLEPELNLSAEQVDNIMALINDVKGSKSLSLPKGLIVVREYDKLIFSKSKISKKSFETELPIPGTVKIPEYNILITSKLSNKINKTRRNSLEANLDYDTITPPLIIRARRHGDVFCPIGLKGKKKVKDIFIDEKVPKRYRDRIPIVVSGSDICFIPGYRIGEKFKIGSKTKHILNIKVKGVEKIWQK